MHDLSMPLWERYLMTIEEASSYFRIGENKLRQIANEHNPYATERFFLWNNQEL